MHLIEQHASGSDPPTSANVSTSRWRLGPHGSRCRFMWGWKGATDQSAGSAISGRSARLARMVSRGVDRLGACKGEGRWMSKRGEMVKVEAKEQAEQAEQAGQAGQAGQGYLPMLSE